jgi:hypothetical protein
MDGRPCVLVTYFVTGFRLCIHYNLESLQGKIAPIYLPHGMIFSITAGHIIICLLRFVSFVPFPTQANLIKRNSESSMAI